MFLVLATFPFLETKIEVSKLCERMQGMQETQEMQVSSLGQGDPLEKEMAIHSGILAWKVPWTRAWWATIHGIIKSGTRLSN